MLWDKIDYLAGLGLTPWYVDGCNAGVPCHTCSIEPRSPYPQNCSVCTVCDEAEWRQQQPAGVRAAMTAAQLGANYVNGTEDAMEVPLYLRSFRDRRSSSISFAAIHCAQNSRPCLCRPSRSGHAARDRRAHLPQITRAA